MLTDPNSILRRPIFIDYDGKSYEYEAIPPTIPTPLRYSFVYLTFTIGKWSPYSIVDDLIIVILKYSGPIQIPKQLEIFKYSSVPSQTVVAFR